MYRKFRLSQHRKNEFRKARNRSVAVTHISTISVPSIYSDPSPTLDDLSRPVSPDELTVSIASDVALNTDVNSLGTMRHWINLSSALPPGTNSNA